MSTDTKPEKLSAAFTPWISIETDADGSNPRIKDIDWSDSYQNVVGYPGGEFRDDDEGQAAMDFMDSKLDALHVAIKAVLDGKHIVVLPSRPIETESFGDEADGVIVWFAGPTDADTFRVGVNEAIYG